MTYKINGVALLQGPSKGQWTDKELATDGNNRPIYPAVQEYQLYWVQMNTAAFNQIWNAWRNVSVTGSCVVELPDIAASTEVFREFSGCILEKPQVGEYFEWHYSDVKMLVRNVRVY